MAQCEGRTKKGERCRRESGADSAFCSIHVDQAVRPRTESKTSWDSDSIFKAAVGFALVGAIFVLRLRR